jgi:NitT/TauT family transport system substrate-binding protein
MSAKARIVALGLAASLALSVLAGGAAAAKKVRAVNFHVLYLAPIFVAKEKGFFAKEGLDMEMIRVKAGRLATTAILAGEAEFSTSSTIRESVVVRRKGKKLIRIYSIANRMTMDLVVRNDVIKKRKLSRDMPLMARFKALKGLRIGVTAPGALTDVVSRYYLRRAGFNPNRDAQIIPLGGKNLAPAFRSGRIDAFMLSPPRPLWLERQGHGKIIIKSSAGDVPEFKNYEYTGTTVTQKWLDKNSESARAFCRAMNAANRAWRKDINVAIDSAQKYFGYVPRDIIEISIRALKASLSPDGIVKKSAVKQYMDFLNGFDPKRFPRQILDASEGIHFTNKFNPNAT